MMHSLAITLFELGQFLRIVLWIALPMFMLTLLVTAYVHHRKTRSGRETPALLSLDQDGFPEVLARLHPTEKEVEAEGETVYQGLLWMKRKYEQDRELADEKYGRLRSSLASSGDQLEEKNLQIAFLQSQLDQRIKSYHELEYEGRDNKDRLGELQGQLGALQGQYVQALRLLDERQTTIGLLQEQLQQGSRRSEALTSRLASGNHLLQKIRQELDRLTGEEWLPEEPMQLEPVA